jgi:hypothetical protein
MNYINRSLESRIEKLESILYKRKYIKFEGGASGHMQHIYDYTDFTLNDIKDIITNLLYGKVEDVTEKLDGMNIQCTMNSNGNVVFIRNKGDLNSNTGGMSADDMAAKWSTKPRVANVYLNAAEIIIKVFNKIGKSFFNPDNNTKVVANCECITTGKTNILMYANAQVDFHNLWVYTREDENSEWIKSDITSDGISTLENACNGIEGAQLTPRVIIKVTEKSNNLVDYYTSKIDDIFSEAGCTDNNTIEDYKKARFYDLCDKQYKWITQSEEGQEVLYNRWFNDDKSTSLRELKKIYKDNIEQLNSVDYKKVVYLCMKPIDTFFGSLGNSVISVCDGMINAGVESKVISELSNDLSNTVAMLKKEGSAEINDTLTTQLNRLSELGNQINATEGIVFRYGDKLMKVTGSFASINQILGLRFRL